MHRNIPLKKYSLIGGSTVAVVLLVLGSLNNIVGYQTVQASNQKIINNEVDQKELLFQTILDMAINREIQKVILGSEITGKRFFDTGVRFSVFNPSVLTEKFLKHAYTMGVVLSKTISKAKIHSLLEKYLVSNQVMQKEINAVIEKDVKLKGEMTQLSNSQCDCENENISNSHFQIICTLLFPLYCIIFLIWEMTSSDILTILLDIFNNIVGEGTLNCWWYHGRP
jgi:hypothetical protein